jgi:hypothetical protein
MLEFYLWRKLRRAHTFLAFAFDWIKNKRLFHKHILMDMKLKHRSFGNVSFYHRSCSRVSVSEVSTGIPISDSRGKRDGKNREKRSRKTLRKTEEYHLAFLKKQRFSLSQMFITLVFIK